jgi:hypothetical protein
MDTNLRYFVRDTLYCDLMQWKYLVKDYVSKKKYKTIAFSGEFGPELQFVLPFAYWHYKMEHLKKPRVLTTCQSSIFFLQATKRFLI